MKVTVRVARVQRTNVIVANAKSLEDAERRALGTVERDAQPTRWSDDPEFVVEYSYPTGRRT